MTHAHEVHVLDDDIQPADRGVERLKGHNRELHVPQYAGARPDDGPLLSLPTWIFGSVDCLEKAYVLTGSGILAKLSVCAPTVVFGSSTS